jgi:TM2 domain-containing membrane protein YozV
MVGRVILFVLGFVLGFVGLVCFPSLQELYEMVETVVVERGPKWNRAFALLLSLIIPGLGQLYKGQIISAILWFVITMIGYIPFVIPGLVLHVLCALGAASGRTDR